VGHPTHPVKLPKSMNSCLYDTNRNIDKLRGDCFERHFSKSCFNSL
jgi:hypothetical protein